MAKFREMSLSNGRRALLEKLVAAPKGRVSVNNLQPWERSLSLRMRGLVFWQNPRRVKTAFAIFTLPLDGNVLVITEAGRAALTI